MQREEKLDVETFLKCSVITGNPNSRAISFIATPNSYLVAPEFTITTEQLVRLNNSANKLIDELKINLKCYVVKNLSNDYYVKTLFSIRKKNIERFTNDLAFLVNKDQDYDKRSLMIVIAVNDRQIRIRTGSEIAERLSSSNLGQIIGDVAPYFRRNDFVGGIEQIFDNSYFYYKWGNTILYSIIILFVGIFATVFGVSLFKECTKIYIDPDGVEKLKKLKKELEKNKPKKLFLDTTCVICLEEFNNVDSNKNDKEKDLKLIDSPSEVGLNEDKTTVLPCGHRFHDDCIKDWMKKENTCPTCRCNIDPEATNEQFSKNLVEVQRVNYPSLNAINFIILSDSLSWSLPANNTIDVVVGNSGGSSMWDVAGGMASGVGGASGDW